MAFGMQARLHQLGGSNGSLRRQQWCSPSALIDGGCDVTAPDSALCCCVAVGQGLKG